MPKNKISSNPEVLGFDLLFHLSYLSSSAAAGIPRSRIFQMASRLSSSVAPYFQKVHVLAEKMNYDYSEACRMVGEVAPDSQIKSLLLRISSSLTAGEAERDFLERETRVQADSYSNEYEGKVETMRKYTDAYTAVTISAALVIVVAVVSMLIYNVSTAFIMGLIAVAVAAPPPQTVQQNMALAPEPPQAETPTTPALATLALAPAPPPPSDEKKNWSRMC